MTTPAPGPTPRPPPPPPTPLNLFGEEDIPKPRIGGVISTKDGPEPWVGGSNISRLLLPTYVGQRRPLKHSSAIAVEENCKKGVTYKLGSNPSSSDVAFTVWVEDVQKRLIEMGLDTVFRVMLPSTGNSTTEIFIVEAWGQATSDLVDPWVSKLKYGFNGQPPCSYDAQSLSWSADFLRNSLKPEFARDIRLALPSNTTGPQVFVEIVAYFITLQTSLQRELISELAKLHITKEEGENVKTLSHKITDKVTQIEKVASPPADLNQLVCACFKDPSVPIFAQEVNTKYLALQRNPQAYKWRELLRDFKDLYLQLSKDWHPSQQK